MTAFTTNMFSAELSGVTELLDWRSDAALSQPQNEMVQQSTCGGILLHICLWTRLMFLPRFQVPGEKYMHNLLFF